MENLEVMPIAVLRFRPALTRFDSHSLNGGNGLNLLLKSLLVKLSRMVLGAEICIERCISPVCRFWAEEEAEGDVSVRCLSAYHTQDLTNRTKIKTP